MATRWFSFAMGVVYLVIGIMGFNTPLLWPVGNRAGWENMYVQDYYGDLLGMIPTNGVHNVLYLLLGGVGILAAISDRAAERYCRVLFAVATALTIIGCAPGSISSLGHLIPLFGFNVMVHAATAVLAWYFGMIYPMQEESAASDAGALSDRTRASV
jgi:hypothetical protein